ncbi:MAG: hypothetical protein RL660_1458 [Bacteroidota bacterium]
MNHFIATALAFCCSIALLTPTYAQDSKQRISSYNKLWADTNHPINTIAFRNIGPSVMSGRVTDIEVNPNNPNEFYVAYASGGVWHTSNNGVTLNPIFDKEASITIGDMCMHWPSGTLYVGTGECNSSRSSYAGTGVYKTTDTGKHWQLIAGTEHTEHISKLIATDAKGLYIASMGSLFSSNASNAGLFFYDGTSTKRVKVDSDNTGIIDLRVDAKKPNTIFACTWQRTRRPWQFTGEGNGSAIYKSEDAGKTWNCITCGNEGFPHNDKVGRIGIAISNQNSDILYALLDNQNTTKDTSQKEVLSAFAIRDMNTDAFLKLDEKKLNTFLRKNDYPKEYTAATLKKDVKANKFTPAQIAEWILSDRNYSLFDTRVIGAELYKSENGGRTWKKTHDKPLDGLFFTYGYYFGIVEVDPTNDKNVYVAGFRLLRSANSGSTFKNIMQENCHPDYHRIYINPKNTAHLIAGNDGGINISYDTGATWIRCNSPAVGQFYSIQVDNATPYNVYGGLQDNGTWVGKSNTVDDRSWQYTGEYPYKEIGGGDGMQVMVDTRDNNTVYTGYQFGFYQRGDRNGRTQAYIHPTHKIGEEALRYNWQTPIHLSKHQQDILYMGSNKIMVGLNKGADMKIVSKDLTSTKQSGNVPFGTISTMSESPLRFGLLYCGTDDGNVWRSTDGGYTVEQINTPAKNKWVTRVVASKYKQGRVYICHSGHTQDDFAPYIYRSEDSGKTWTNIASNLPNEPINVVREDTRDTNIIYVGTDNGLYVSFDKGGKYVAWTNTLPRVAIHDIAIQERDNDIVLGTHGRSIYIASLSKVQQLDSLSKIGFCLFAIDSVQINDEALKTKTAIEGAEKPSLDFEWYNSNAAATTLLIKQGKRIIHSATINAEPGFNTYKLDIHDGASVKLTKGIYTIELSAGDKKQSQKLKVY